MNIGQKGFVFKLPESGKTKKKKKKFNGRITKVSGIDALTLVVLKKIVYLPPSFIEILTDTKYFLN